MPIEDPKKIDIVTRPGPGRLALLITDSGQTKDPDVRLAMFRAKLATYIDYVENPKFPAEYGVTRNGVIIVLVSQNEATPEMKAITSVQLSKEPITLPVVFDRFDEGSE